MTISDLSFEFNDGGREDAGFKGGVGDCVTRAIAIAEDRDYSEVRKELMEAVKMFRECSYSHAARHRKSNSVRNGTPKEVYRPYLLYRGWKRTALQKFGSSDRKHMKMSDLPLGVVIVEQRKHIAAVIDHTLQDTWDSRLSNKWVNGAPTNVKACRCVNAIWTK